MDAGALAETVPHHGGGLLGPLVFWLSFLWFPLAAWLGLSAVRAQRFRPLIVLAAIPMALFFYARFVEPHRLLTVPHTVNICGEGLPGTLKAAVISDLHRGAFGNTPSVARLVRAINASGADFVLMAGDFTDGLAPEKFATSFAPLATLAVPAYAVLGNHDAGFPGTDVTAPLTQALRDARVEVLAPGEAVFGARGKYVRIVGFRDYWTAHQNGDILGDYPAPQGMPIIYLQHNPDLARDFNVGSFDLLVAGHTHGGQIWLPWLTCRLTFACDTLRYGQAETQSGKLFVTSGVGMTGLPLRFGAAPRVDVLTLVLERCRPAPLLSTSVSNGMFN